MTDLSAPSAPVNVGVPPLHPLVVDRPRLVDAVLGHFQAERIVRIVGIAGSGKTTTAGQVARASPIPVGWVTVESWDESPARFLADLSIALRDVAPGLRRLADDQPYREPEELAATIGRLLGPREALLVVARTSTGMARGDGQGAGVDRDGDQRPQQPAAGRPPRHHRHDERVSAAR